MTDVLEPNIKIILYYTALDRRKGEFYATLLGPRSFNVKQTMEQENRILNKTCRILI